MTTAERAEIDANVGLLRPAIAVATLVGGVSVFLLASRVRGLEASTSAFVARLFGLGDAHAVGDTVLLQTTRGLAGYDVALGCTVAFLLVPFVVVTLGLLSIARISAPRALASLACAVLTLTAVNQARLFVIALGMHAWGPRLGYARTHLLVGTLISTVGVVLAGATYLAVLLGLRPARWRRSEGESRG